MITFKKLDRIVRGKFLNVVADHGIRTIVTDSRKTTLSDDAIFFAIKGEHHDGHDYVATVFEKGIRQFVVETPDKLGHLVSNANVIQVESALEALQQLVAYHRALHGIPVIGITGSNGKTIIKEWLFQLLSPDFMIAKNPGSYNSQLGVPLSVWQIQPYHQLGIFEAGISRPGEMEKLQAVIQPTIGVFTNIGSAHDEGFNSLRQKVEEKLLLFNHADILIFCADHQPIQEAVHQKKFDKILSWAFNSDADIRITKNDNLYLVSFREDSFSLNLNFSDQASVENCFHCVAVMLHLKYSAEVIQSRINMLQSVPMRLELKDGINQSQIIDDTYNNDLAGLQISLDFLANQHQKKNKRLILSDIFQSGLGHQQLAHAIAELVSAKKIKHFVGVGKILAENKKLFPDGSEFFETTEEFINDFDTDKIHDELVLVKGARSFHFEKIVNKLQRKVHGTVMEVDLGAVVHNLNFFKTLLKPATKVMVMVKAFGYGSGSVEIANLLNYHKVNYLGVAYADEGIDLRKNNISLPIMVMNPAEESFTQLLQHNLEPEIYSFKILKTFLSFLSGRDATVHIKIDTGMHRLGFEESDLSELVKLLKSNSHLKVGSVFSHLAGADEAAHDEFSLTQGKRFLRIADQISTSLGYKPLYHILNSPGILRLPELQFDMVRLGIGLYGIDPTENPTSPLKPVATLKTIISQIKIIRSGETVGYGRHGKAEGDKTIATIAIGYADGYSRAFGRGIGKVLVKGQLAPVIGNVCMDMTMIDITGIDTEEGDEVIIFGKGQPIQSVAKQINTIPYEILTNTSERVKRIFVAESI